MVNDSGGPNTQQLQCSTAKHGHKFERYSLQTKNGRCGGTYLWVLHVYLCMFGLCTLFAHFLLWCGEKAQRCVLFGRGESIYPQHGKTTTCTKDSSIGQMRIGYVMVRESGQADLRCQRSKNVRKRSGRWKEKQKSIKRGK